MDPIQKLTEIFSEFPGIGPRQAKRFAYFLLTRNNDYLGTLTDSLSTLKKSMQVCKSCFRFFVKNKGSSELCAICSDKNRDKKTLMIVSRDVDLETIEKNHLYLGYYFVLGGGIPILEKNPENKIRGRELKLTIQSRASEGLSELIIALNLTPEGENTTDYLIKFLEAETLKYGIKISTLGRGLSTGTELEYSDADTIKNALKNRS